MEGRRWSREREDRPSREEWRRGEGTDRPTKPTTEDRRPWRLPRREDASNRPFRPVRPIRGDRPTYGDRPSYGDRPIRGDRDRPALVTEPPRGEAHAEAAPSDLIWGRHSAQAALESERPIHRVWCTAEMRFRPPFLQLLREAKASGVLVEEVTWARLGQLSGGAVHQGIVLQPAAADTLDLPSLIEGCRQLEESPLLVAVDGLTDPQNLGAILRSAEALGVHGLVLPQRRNAGLTGSVAKVAAGALEHLPVARVVNLNRALDTLRQEGYRVVGLDAQGSVSLEEADLDGPLVVITGSEGQGLSLLTRRSCDQLVRIPLRGTTPSLNASVATALVLYEVARRSWMRGLRGMAKPPRLVRPTVPTQPLETPAPAPPPLAQPPEPAEPVALVDQPAVSPPAEASSSAEASATAEASVTDAFSTTAEPSVTNEPSATDAFSPTAVPNAHDAFSPTGVPIATDALSATEEPSAALEVDLAMDPDPALPLNPSSPAEASLPAEASVTDEASPTAETSAALGTPGAEAATAAQHPETTTPFVVDIHL